MNRADRLKAEGEGRRGNVVGFALTILQRRLASSPEAIYQSLDAAASGWKRGCARSSLRDAAALRQQAMRPSHRRGLDRRPDDIDDLPDEELEELEEEVVDQATAARTIAELEAEIATLQRPRGRSPSRCATRAPTRSGSELVELLQDDDAEMFDATGQAPQADRLHRAPGHAQLPVDRIRTLLGRPEAVVVIHGGMRPRGAPQGAGGVHAGPGRVRARRDRRRRRGHQPAARAPDGQLRPAVEPEPDRAAVRAHPPHRADRGLPPVEPRRRRDARRAGLPAAPREARGAAQGARRPGLRRARRASSKTARCATC